NRAVGAIDAAVARFGLQHRPAGLAVIEVLAGVDRHGFRRARAAGGADQRRLQADIHTGGSIQNVSANSPTASRMAPVLSQSNVGRAHRLSDAQARRCRHMTTEAPASRKTAPNSNSCWD